MSFKVQVGPPQISIHHGQMVLISEQDGEINWPSEKVSISLIHALSAVGASMPMANPGSC